MNESWEWRRLYNEEIHSLYRSRKVFRLIVSRKPRLAGNVARIEESRNAFKILTGKRSGMRRFRRPRSRWEDNIRMDLKEIGVNTRNLNINNLREKILAWTRIRTRVSSSTHWRQYVSLT